MNGKRKWLSLLIVSCLLFTSCKAAGDREEPAADGGESGQAEERIEGSWGKAFAYANASNELCLWMQGGTEPVVLTERLIGTDAALLNEYGEEELQQLMWSLDDDKAGYIAYSPDKEAVYFPSDYWFFNVEDSKLFSIYDLYSYSPDGRQEIAEAVTDYKIGENGVIWYSRLAEANEDGTASYIGMEKLYRYDGKEHLLVGELGDLGQNSFQIVKNGDYAVYRDAGGALYGGGPEKLSKLADKADEDFYAALDGSRILYRNGEEIISADTDNPEERKTIAMGGGRNEVYLLDERGEELLLVEKDELTYSDLLENDAPEEEGQTAELWELLKDEKLEENLVKCRVGVFHTLTGEYTQLEEGYMTEALEYEEMSPAGSFYFLEIIPKDDFVKIPLSRYFPSETAAELLEDYEYLGAYAFADAGDTGSLYEAACGYIAGKDVWSRLENMNLSGQNEVRKTYNKITDTLYIRILRSITDPEGEMVGGGEDVYEIDKSGACRLVVESAGQALVVRDKLYYTRSFGEEGRQKLFHLENGFLMEAQGIDLDRMMKSEKTGELYYLTGTYGIYDIRSGTLTVKDATGDTELEEQVYSFLLYGDECVAALQNKLDEESGFFAYKMFAGGGYDTGRLVIIEDGNKKTLDERAVILLRIAEKR